ncbi:MAG: HAMP domain-containing sensor histidine kinase [Pseudomonadota bacterium]
MTGGLPGNPETVARVLSHDLAALIRSARQLSAYAREDVLREDADATMHAIGMLDVRLAHIDRFVSELIRYCRAGERTYRAEPFSVTDLVQTLFGKISPGIEAQLHLTCSRDVLIADPDVVRGTLTEIMTNAVQHHDKPVTLRLDVEVTQVDDESICIVIEDNGPGVADGFISRIKEPFVKTGGRAGAAGLGLAICDQEVRAAGGRLNMRQAGSGGLCVELMLPGGLEAAAKNPSRPSIEPLKSSERPSLKVV